MTEKQSQEPKKDAGWSSFWNKVLPTTMGFEGGVDTNQVGGSGNSNRGVTQKAWDAYVSEGKAEGKRVEDLSYGEAARFAYDKYFKGPKIDSIPSDTVKQVLFDDAYNAGPSTAIKRLQQIVGAEPDGKIGPKTLKAVTDHIAANGEGTLASALLDSRQNFYQDLVMKDESKYGKFANGWNNRIQKLKDMLIPPAVASEGETDPSTWGNRTDGTPKGRGFMGPLKRPDGGVSTELSIGVNMDGKEQEIPSLVPTLSKLEVKYLLGGGKPTKEIVGKAVQHARERMAKGLSPYSD